jgi:hypothetical protein
MHLQANRSKDLEKTFTNNGVESLEKLSFFSLIFHGKIHHEKNKFKGFRFKSKVRILILHTNKIKSKEKRNSRNLKKENLCY